MNVFEFLFKVFELVVYLISEVIKLLIIIVVTPFAVVYFALQKFLFKLKMAKQKRLFKERINEIIESQIRTSKSKKERLKLKEDLKSFNKRL